MQKDNNYTKTTNTQKTTSSKKRNREKEPLVLDWMSGSHDCARGERAMWIAVITQAMMDALTRSQKPEEQFCKFEARRWLTGNSANFCNVCMLAGLDPDYVRMKAKKALLTGGIWRAEAGTGKRYHERKAYRERIKQESLCIPHPSQCLSHSLITENLMA